ncbi:MAG: iron export ABC transporter permease subunit FetB [Candidatus Hydrogenedentes bacterium]|nr:iron export ABC transporter permease subunit FetB [Candidatus Hydrogenedentota bacterium]
MIHEGAIPLSIGDLFGAAGLVCIAGAVSIAFRLGVEYRLALASIRTVIQLLLIGYVLRWVFDVENGFAIAAVMTVMLIAASRAALQRSSRSFRGAGWRAFLTLVLCGLTTTFVVTQTIIQTEPWYEPRYIIPLLGMVLGNSLTGISLCIDHLLEQFSTKRAVVEMELAHGATGWEAGRDLLRDAVRRGMIPIINSMMVVGIVSLPGMMTGQILAGADPLEAVKYQIVVMFMIASATSLGCILIALLVQRHLFNAKHQLRMDVIVNTDK